MTILIDQGNVANPVYFPFEPWTHKHGCVIEESNWAFCSFRDVDSVWKGVADDFDGLYFDRGNFRL